MLEIRYDDAKIKQLQRELRSFGKNALPRVMSQGLNRTATQARTTISRRLKVDLDIKRIKDVRDRMTIKKATYRKWLALLLTDTHGIYAYSWGYKKTKAGIRVRDFSGTVKWRLFRHAFIAEMPSGHVGIFVRRYPESLTSHGLTSLGKRRKGRLPIDEIAGLSGTEFSKIVLETIEKYQKQINGILQKNIHDQVQLTLRRRLPA